MIEEDNAIYKETSCAQWFHMGVSRAREGVVSPSSGGLKQNHEIPEAIVESFPGLFGVITTGDYGRNKGEGGLYEKRDFPLNSFFPVF